MQAFYKNLFLPAVFALSVVAVSTHAASAQEGEKTPAPSLVTKSTPAPEVIYNKGSRDAILIAQDAVIENSLEAPIQTPITAKVREFDNDYQKLLQTTQAYQDRLAVLQSDADASAGRYFANVARINTELQSGTTPGNPILVERWNDAQRQLDILSGLTSTLNTLSSDLAAEATRAAFLQDNIRATYSLSGAVKQDHIRLRQVEDDVTQGIVGLNRMLSLVSDEINRRQSYLRTEKLNMQTLSLAIAKGELYGQNLSNSLFRQASVEQSKPTPPPVSVDFGADTKKEAAASKQEPEMADLAPVRADVSENAPVAATPTLSSSWSGTREENRTASLSNQPIALSKSDVPKAPTTAPEATAEPPAPAFAAGRKPLVIIRFNKPNVNYEQPLYGAVNAVLERMPEAQFDLVAVSTTNGNVAEQALSSTEARKNGESVLRSLSQMGLPLERVRLNAASSTSVNNTEVHLYLK